MLFDLFGYVIFCASKYDIRWILRMQEMLWSYIMITEWETTRINYFACYTMQVDLKILNFGMKNTENLILK